MTPAELLEDAIALYERGDFDAALHAFRQLAELGHPVAQFHMGRLHSRGEGVLQDHESAAEWYRKAAEQGDFKAQHNLGMMCQTGQGLPLDLVEAVSWFRKAAAQGSSISQLALGGAYLHGKGVPQDYELARQWIQAAGNQGLARAQVVMGTLYEDGTGVARDMTLAACWFRKAADQGHADAQYALGRLYADALGVPRDYVEATKWIRKAAEQGLPLAQFSLGIAYLHAQGVPQDVRAALYWIGRAADQGDAGAQHSLGFMHMQGHGTPQDFPTAAFWFRKAADQGLARSQHALGMMLFRGQGVPRDIVQAYRWLLLATAAADTHEEHSVRDGIAEAREDVASEMTQAQIAEAQRLAGEWKPKTAEQSINEAAFASARAWRRSDELLATFSSLPADQWHGRHVFASGEIVFADPEKACALLGEAMAVTDARDVGKLLKLFDDALKLDYPAALGSSEVLERRAAAYLATGLDGPQRARELYNIGVALAWLNRWRDAGAVYQAAADLDPLFAWHLNNFAWMASTSSDLRAHAGEYAVVLATKACEISGWGCWAFIGTLAAAFARAGDFRRAAQWQQISTRLAPSHEQDKAREQLKTFESGQAWTDHGHQPAAGAASPSAAELAQIDLESLLTNARELMAEKRRVVQ